MAPFDYGQACGSSLSGFPRVIGYAFAWTQIERETLTFGSGRAALFGTVRWSVPRDQITRIERTQCGGVRFFAEGRSDPWVIGSLRPRHLLAKLRRHGLEPEGSVVRSRWNTI